MLTQEILKELLHYNPETGDFTRKITTSSRAIAGCIAGGDCGKGYITIWIGGSAFRAHRLAFLYMTGKFPKNQVDHINRKKDDNRWKNLKDVTNQENHKNKDLQKNNKSGVAGVSLVGQSKRWCSYIKVNGEKKHLGHFTDFFSAVCARKSAEIRYGFNENYGLKMI